jgi:hypothetical protein
MPAASIVLASCCKLLTCEGSVMISVQAVKGFRGSLPLIARNLPVVVLSIIRGPLRADPSR